MAKAVQNLRHEARAAYATGELVTAIAKQVQLVNASKAEPQLDDYKLLGLYFFSLGDYASSLTVLEDILKIWPGEPESRKNLGLCLLRLRRLDEAEAALNAALEEDPEDANLYDGLAHVAGLKGDLKAVCANGERSLRFKDAAHPVPEGLSLKRREMPAFDSAAPGRNIIAFSLWGTEARYIEGALENARLATDIYAGWRCRFYLDETVPAFARSELLSAGADVVLMPKPAAQFEGLFWRFLPANEKGIDRFLVRDADSVINLREWAAVMEWVDSGKAFHLMRDWHTHTDTILAGMWGGVAGVLPNLNLLWGPYISSVTMTANCDQKFLRETVWPLIRDDVMIHDRYFTCFGAKPFPTHTDRPGNWHVGQNVWGRRDGGLGRLSTSQRSPIVERQRYVFPLTTGRSGTAFLARLFKENFKDAEVRHESTGYQAFGRETPDASHFTLYNSLGNTTKVKDFWHLKAASCRYGPGQTYIEVSHFLAKAGLLDNLDAFGRGAEIHIVHLTRDIADTAWSLANRFDFANYGFTWLFYLDPRYPKNLVSAKPFINHGVLGSCVWYVHEMRARAAYYKRRYGERQHLTFHQIDLKELATEDGSRRLLSAIDPEDNYGKIKMPGEANVSKQWLLPQEARAEIEAIVKKINVDYAAIAAKAVKRRHFE
ncbi:MAG: tetratricopeptide repeat protein [Kiloniellales bacterium]